MKTYIGFVSMILVSVSSVGLVYAKDDELKRIETSLPQTVKGTHAIAASTIARWMNEIEIALSSNDYDFVVSCEFSFQFRKNEVSYVGMDGVNFRWAERHLNNEKRLITTIQPLLGNEAIAKNDGVASDESSQADMLQRGARALLWRMSGGGPPDDILREGPPSDFQLIFKMDRVFHPVRATVVQLSQTLVGESSRLSGHSILKETIQGSVKAGPYVHVLISIGGTVQMMVTFLDEVPVQTEVWHDVNEKNGEPIVHDVIRSYWREYKKGLRLPIKINGVRQHKVRPCELVANIPWKIGKDVDDVLFDRDSLGWVAADHSVPVLKQEQVK